MKATAEKSVDLRNGLAMGEERVGGWEREKRREKWGKAKKKRGKTVKDK